MPRKRKDEDTPDLLGGTLNILGLKIDFGELLAAPDQVVGRLDELRQRLKAAGARETLTDVEWARGGVRVSGQIRTRGLLGDREYHLGTTGRPSAGPVEGGAPPPDEALEPPVDVFDEGQRIVVVADVPGVELADLELEVHDDVLSLATAAGARRSYRKQVKLPAAVDPDSLQTTCRNGVLQVEMKRRRRAGKARGSRAAQSGKPNDTEAGRDSRH